MDSANMSNNATAFIKHVVSFVDVCKGIIVQQHAKAVWLQVFSDEQMLPFVKMLPSFRNALTALTFLHQPRKRANGRYAEQLALSLSQLNHLNEIFLRVDVKDTRDGQVIGGSFSSLTGVQYSLHVELSSTMSAQPSRVT